METIRYFASNQHDSPAEQLSKILEIPIYYHSCESVLLGETPTRWDFYPKQSPETLQLPARDHARRSLLVEAMQWKPRAKESPGILECPVRYLILRLPSAGEQATLGFNRS